jgi:hypothetical protein
VVELDLVQGFLVFGLELPEGKTSDLIKTPFTRKLEDRDPFIAIRFEYRVFSRIARQSQNQTHIVIISNELVIEHPEEAGKVDGVYTREWPR